MNGAKDNHALDYTRRLHKEVSDWYTSADNKAQILLTLNGGLLGFLGGAAFWGAEDLENVLRAIGYETFAFFIAFLLSLGLSIASALICLKSRLRQGVEKSLPATPENLWFFQRLSAVAPKDFVQGLRSMTPETEIEILSSQIQILSFNVVNKHVWFNHGFKFFVVGLLSFLMVVATHLLRLHLEIKAPFSPGLFLTSLVVVAGAAMVYRRLDAREERKAHEFQLRFEPSPTSPESSK